MASLDNCEPCDVLDVLILILQYALSYVLAVVLRFPFSLTCPAGYQVSVRPVDRFLSDPMDLAITIDYSFVSHAYFTRRFAVWPIARQLADLSLCLGAGALLAAWLLVMGSLEPPPMRIVVLIDSAEVCQVRVQGVVSCSLLAWQHLLCRVRGTIDIVSPSLVCEAHGMMMEMILPLQPLVAAFHRFTHTDAGSTHADMLDVLTTMQIEAVSVHMKSLSFPATLYLFVINLRCPSHPCTSELPAWMEGIGQQVGKMAKHWGWPAVVLAVQVEVAVMQLQLLDFHLHLQLMHWSRRHGTAVEEEVEGHGHEGTLCIDQLEIRMDEVCLLDSSCAALAVAAEVLLEEESCCIKDSGEGWAQVLIPLQ